jgi:hypothetical protein
MTYRLMYDSNVLDDIPADARIAASYGTGPYAVNIGQFIQRFPSVPRVLIDITGEDPQGCSVLDVENGAATPADAPAWIRDRLRTAGNYAIVYCALDTMSSVMGATGDLIHGKDYWFWIANPEWDFATAQSYADNTPGVIGVQYQWPGYGSPGHYDVSVITANWWHADPAPVTVPKPPVVPGVRYGTVFTQDPDWASAAHPQQVQVISRDGGVTWVKP